MKQKPPDHFLHRRHTNVRIRTTLREITVGREGQTTALRCRHSVTTGLRPPTTTSLFGYYTMKRRPPWIQNVLTLPSFFSPEEPPDLIANKYRNIGADSSSWEIKTEDKIVTMDFYWIRKLELVDNLLLQYELRLRKWSAILWWQRNFNF
jgi:hypothetical protein